MNYNSTSLQPRQVWVAYKFITHDYYEPLTLDGSYSAMYVGYIINVQNTR